jgi:hypothetical protein
MHDLLHGDGRQVTKVTPAFQRRGHRERARQDPRERGGHGYNPGKYVNGRKRHTLINT